MVLDDVDGVPSIRIPLHLARFDLAPTCQPALRPRLPKEHNVAGLHLIAPARHDPWGYATVLCAFAPGPIFGVIFELEEPGLCARSLYRSSNLAPNIHGSNPER